MRKQNTLPKLTDIAAASVRIAPYARETPVFTSTYFNRLTGGEIFFKCENFQKVGAFKFRGACNAVFSLSENEARHGVATHSSGNHGQAVALAAKLRGIPAHVVMPEYAPALKVRAVKGYGADVFRCENSMESREKTLEEVIEDTGARFIHPYDDFDVICGQGTTATELLDEIPDLDMIISPVGGGGLLSGISIAAKSINPNIRVIGVEPEVADDAYRSFKTGKHIKDGNSLTVADGLRATLGELNFRIIKKYADDIVTVSESSIIRDMRTVWERMNIIIEPSSAVPVSALTDGKIDISGKKAGLIITGGNLDLETLPWQS